MLNLHPPFRRASDADATAISRLVGQPVRDAEAVVAEVDGRIVAVLAGRVSGETWHLETLAADEGHLADLGPRMLRLADALAAEDEVGAVSVRPDILPDSVGAMLDEEGFVPAADGSGLMVRPVVPQG